MILFPNYLKIICIYSEISTAQIVVLITAQRREDEVQVKWLQLAAAFALRSEEQSARSVEMQFSCCCHAPLKLMAIDSTPLAASLLIGTIEVVVVTADSASSASVAVNDEILQGNEQNRNTARKTRLTFFKKLHIVFGVPFWRCLCLELWLLPCVGACV